MAAAWRALVKLLGFGKQEETKSQPVRYHPYDEVSDEQLAENRSKTPRCHPYDEISDEQLKEKQRPPRFHPYDEVSPDQLQENRREQSRNHPYDEVRDSELEQKRKNRPVPKKRTTKQKSGTTNSDLHYVDVDIVPGPKGGNAARPSLTEEEPIIYTEVRPSASS